MTATIGPIHEEVKQDLVAAETQSSKHVSYEIVEEDSKLKKMFNDRLRK